MSGWIKLHRKLLKNALISDPDYLALWVRLLLMASHEETYIIFNGSKMPIKPGSFVTSRLKLSQQSHIHRSKLERILNYLKSEQQIEQVNLGTGRLISITNWHKYQDYEQANEQPMSSQRAASEQPVSTIKNVKNVKNVKNNISLSIDEDFSQFWLVYPKKVGKQDARTAWVKHCPNGELEHIKSALTWQKNLPQWIEDEGRFIPNPATYIRQHRWEDQEPIKPEPEHHMTLDELREKIRKEKSDAGR